ncbi:XRE family transcriptional regulator [Neisseria sp. Ec49-e6-T10]|uniref:XRE family transcriptional regulator n=1 Tax=Neisseria sp. Ec49-e6-T10 TaxID=3140744 RepID=UPI003EBE0617
MNWFDILKNAVAHSSQGQVAVAIGYSPTTINQVLKGKYAGKTDKVAQRVIDVLAVVECPYQGEKIAMSECKEIAQGPAPSHNPSKMAHWRACQTCILNQK